jgi:cyclase
MKNSPVLSIAKILRKNMTPAEKVLWQKLRRGLLGKKFKRQMPFVFGVYHYVADFYCAECKLIIEIDGDIHNVRDVKDYDIYRENIFKEMGCKIVRFKNDEVLNDIDRVINKIKKEL